MLFWKTKIGFELQQHRFQLPMLPVLLLLAFIIWIAENISTFYQIWLVPKSSRCMAYGRLGQVGFLVFIATAQSGVGAKDF